MPNQSGTRVHTADKYDAEGRRLCTPCGQHWDVSQFGKQSSVKDGLTVACKLCRREEKVRSRYRVSYRELLASQDGKCGMCGANQCNSGHANFAVDHDHRCCPGNFSCGRCVRGLLCLACNSALATLESDRLRTLAEQYLAEHNPMDGTKRAAAEKAVPDWWDVSLAIGDHVVDLGTVEADPRYWKDALAALLRDAADEMDATDLEMPCQDVG